MPATQQPFRGYPTPTSNTTYTPNQFFDVILPHCSRGVVRLIAFMLRKTLGWCDANGNPQEPQIQASYSMLEAHSGISRPHIKRTIEEAIDLGALCCIRKGQPKSPGKSAVSALYEIHWDESGEYITDIEKFNGFYAGEGNRTYVPNAFFDRTIKTETLSTVKVIGAIMRNTIGFQTKYGFRRQQAQMSYKELQNRTKLSSRHLTQAIKNGLEHYHIQRIEEGFFDVHAGKDSKAATYAIRWEDQSANPPLQQNDVEEEIQNRLQKESGNSDKRKVEDRLQKESGIEIKPENKTFEIKQQQNDVAAANTDIFNRLVLEGFDRNTAKQLIESYPKEQIDRQCNWLAKRNITHNRLGMLRRCIEQDWPEPDSGNETNRMKNGKLFASCFYAGRGGNDDEPVAEPSTNEIAAAERFVERLLEVNPDESQIAEWGRSLGAQVREKEKENEKSVVSLILSLRNYGDAFFRAQKARREGIEVQKVSNAAKEHFTSFYPAYLDYLRCEEDKMKHHNSEWYQNWLNRFEQNRFSVQRTEESRLKAFCHEAGLLSFWEWDRQHNPHKFITETIYV